MVACLQSNIFHEFSSSQGLLEPSLDPSTEARLFLSGEDDQFLLGDLSREYERESERLFGEREVDLLLGE